MRVRWPDCDVVFPPCNSIRTWNLKSRDKHILFSIFRIVIVYCGMTSLPYVGKLAEMCTNIHKEEKGLEPLCVLSFRSIIGVLVALVVCGTIADLIFQAIDTIEMRNPQGYKKIDEDVPPIIQNGKGILADIPGHEHFPANKAS